jgi:hypothetical protein
MGQGGIKMKTGANSMGNAGIYVVLMAVMLSLTVVPFGLEVRGSEGSLDNGTDISTGYDPALNLESGFFVENKGQWDENIIFGANTGFGKLGITNDGMVLNIDTEDEETKILKYGYPGSESFEPYGIVELEQKINYYYGNDPKDWVEGARTFSQVMVEDLWDGIDMNYYFDEKGLKYDMILNPYSNPENIRIKVEGMDDMKVNIDTVQMDIGSGTEILDKDLVSFYKDSKNVIGSSFKMISPDTFGVEIDGYDESQEVIIDPVVFATYYGGNNNDEPSGISYDPSGNIYVVGTTYSTDLYLSEDSHKDEMTGYLDGYLLKLKSDGTSVLYSSYFGGISSDYKDISIRCH